MNCNNFIYQTRQPAEVAVAAAAPIPDNSFSFASKVVGGFLVFVDLRQAILSSTRSGAVPLATCRLTGARHRRSSSGWTKPYDAAPLLSRDIAVDRCQRRRADSPSPACALLLVERLAGAGTVTMRNKRVGRGTAVSDAEPMHGTARRREAYMQSRRSPDISELINRELAR